MANTLKEKLNQLAKESGIKAGVLSEIHKLLIKANDPWEEARGILKHKK